MSIRTAISATDAYDYQTELLRYLNNRLTGDMEDRLRCILSDPAMSSLKKEEQTNLALQVFDVEKSMVGNAQTIFVSEAIINEIHEAEQTLIDTVLIEQDIFTPNGIIILEKPFVYELLVDNDNYKEVWEITSICYSSTTEQVAINLYGNLTKVYDSAGDVVYDSAYYSSTEISSMISAHPRSRICLADITVFGFGENGIAYDDSLLSVKRFLVAFFRLTYEYLEHSTEHPSRPSKRRAQRENRPLDGYIVNFKLRRTAYGENGGRHSSPSYAFRVRGHWKRAYLRTRGFPVGDARAYKHVYVKDYIKGRKDFVESRRLVKVEK
jgi:hypothetical protein